MSSSAQDAIPQLDLGNTFGALFIGVILAAVLFGLTNVQAFIYLQAHRNAGMTFFKLVITWLWISDALHLALTIHCVYYYLVNNYANFGVLTEIVWSLKLQLVISALIVPMVHLLYVHRIWKSDYSLIIVNLLHLLNEPSERRSIKSSPGHIVGHGLGVVIPLAWEQVNLFKDLAKTMWSTYLSLGAATFIDIIITSSLCYLLATSRTGFSWYRAAHSLSGSDMLTQVTQHRFIHNKARGLYRQYWLSDKYFFGVNDNHIYVNSFIALLNARYYMQAKAIVDPPQLYERHGVYHQELHTSGSQDEEFHKSQGDPKDEVLRITQPIQGIMVGGCVMVDGRRIIDTP
ncbi:uncharacterized protein HD556DRAFT_1459191 [Suillus plorans]|uniref:Uncharacterized protein n=1 Tax=Suillus plorans TaxID=116603 RepID=A0A9P7AAB5_9AGAM|nr:uncharacterized protein HD556DRAFT_1459191 [Suillus plorans]KAG1785334.1 hypothetical protein HD556DRAFT_1459191 [Suillus plorans]